MIEKYEMPKVETDSFEEWCAAQYAHETAWRRRNGAIGIFERLADWLFGR